MALGDLFSGLGMGLGAAAAGGLRGQNLGEAEVFRRNQIAEDRALKQALYKAQLSKLKAKEPGDTLEQKTAQQMLLELQKNLGTKEALDLLEKQPDLRDAAAELAGDLTLAMRGEKVLDPSKVLVFSRLFGSRMAGAAVSAGGPGAPVTEEPGLTKLPQTESLPPSPGLPQPRLQTGLAHTTGGVLGAVRRSLASPVAGLAPGAPVSRFSVAGTQLAPPDFPQQGAVAPGVADIVDRLPALGGAFSGVAPTPRDTSVPRPPGQEARPPAPTQAEAPPKAEEPLEKYARMLNEGPPSEKLTQGKYETEKAFVARKKSADEPYYKTLDRLAKTPSVQIAINRATITRAQADKAPEIVNTKIDKDRATAKASRASAEKSTEGAETERQLRGVKKQNYASMIATRAAQLRQGWSRLSETQRHNKASEAIQQFNADTNRARQQDTKAYHQSMQEKIRFGLDHWKELELGKDDRAILNYAGRILTAQQGIGPLKGSAASGQVDDALAKAEGVFERIGQKRASGTAPTPVVTKTVTTGSTSKAGQNKVKLPPSGLGKGAPKGEVLQGPAITQGELKSVKAAKAAGPATYKAWVNSLSPNQQKRVRFAERQLSGR